MNQIPSGAPPAPLPPVSAEYHTAMHPAPGKLPQIQKWKMFRSSQGAMHLDFGKTGLIQEPGAKKTILLDHIKKEARIVPPPPHPKAPQPPSAKAPAGITGLPAMPSLPHVKDLGKRMIGGHEAEGKKYTFHPPKAPKLPAAPAKPPAMPGKPSMPAPVSAAPPLSPGKPPAPSAPQVQVQTLEVWTHTQLKVPLLTKANGIPGLKSSECKKVKAGEPSASRFQIPPGYKLVQPKPPSPPRAHA